MELLAWSAPPGATLTTTGLELVWRVPVYYHPAVFNNEPPFLKPVWIFFGDVFEPKQEIKSKHQSILKIHQHTIDIIEK